MQDSLKGLIPSGTFCNFSHFNIAVTLQPAMFRITSSDFFETVIGAKKNIMVKDLRIIDKLILKFAR